MSENEPFGRQRQPIRIDFSGDSRDAYYYQQIIRRYIEGHGDNVEQMGNQLKIYPRAAND